MKNFEEFRAVLIKKIEDLGVTDAEVCRRLGFPRDAVDKIRSGHEPKLGRYIAFMDFLCNSAPLTKKLGDDHMVESLAIPVEGIKHIALPPQIEYSSDIIAMEVESGQYEDQFFKGDVLLYRENSLEGFKNLTSRRPHVMQIKNGGIVVMIIRPGSLEGRYMLIGINSKREVRDNVEIDWCSPIVGTIPAY